jgi:malonyl-CoA O-methyltransferase
MDKKSVIRNFSKAAHLYDEYADIQRLAAFELLSRTPKNGFHNILEIGCGTGIYTHLLRKKFDKTALKAVDISPEMIKVAKSKLNDGSIEFVVADAEDILPDGKFGLITSNASFQWFKSLEKTLVKYKNKLEPGGLLSFSIFGPKTFWELDTVLKGFFKDSSVVAAQFTAKEKLTAMLERNFKEVEIDEIRYCEKFPDLVSLLGKIRHTGTAGMNSKNFFGSQRLRELEKDYRSKFGSIQATHQIFFCRCEGL